MVYATSAFPRLAYTVSSPSEVGPPISLFETRGTYAPCHHRIALLVAIEYAWNTYPSTNRSSLILVASHLLLLIGVFFGYPTGIPRRRVAFKKELVETEPEKVTATEDDSGTDTAEEYGDASDGVSVPTTLGFRVPGEGADKTIIGENSSEEETLSLNLGTDITDSSEMDMMALDDSSL